MRKASAASWNASPSAAKDQGRVAVATAREASSSRNSRRSPMTPAGERNTRVMASCPPGATATTSTGPAGSTPTSRWPRAISSIFTLRILVVAKYRSLELRSWVRIRPTGNAMMWRHETVRRGRGSEQLPLQRRLGWRHEARNIQRQFAIAIKAVAAAGDVEALAQQVGEHALAVHASGEVAVVVAAAVHLLHQAHHVLGALRRVQGQPFAE